VTASPGAAAIDAARTVARTCGLNFRDAVRIGAASNVMLHMRPAPVVARVMTATAVLHDDPQSWLEREVAVGTHLAERGAPAVPPSTLVPPGPHQHGGLWMTFWRFVAHAPGKALPDPAELGRSLRALHMALADYPGELEPVTRVRAEMEQLIGALRPTPELTQTDIDALSAELAQVSPDVFETRLPAQALHGDVALSNLLRTQDGLVWNDLEDVCFGPVEWDVACLAASALARGKSARYVDTTVAAYGDLSTDDLEPFMAVHDLYIRAWQAFRAQAVAADP
jgi:Ser/Thr protein kinase RdoA (MazF antagonist)